MLDYYYPKVCYKYLLDVQLNKSNNSGSVSNCKGVYYFQIGMEQRLPS